MTKPEIWIDRFLVGEMFAPSYVVSNKWIIPASHLKCGESPEGAATRVLTEQIGAKKGRLKLQQVQSHLSQDPKDQESAHWDICFVYGRTLRTVERPEWFSDLKFVKPRDLKSDDFTRGHGDVLRQYGIIEQ